MTESDDLLAAAIAVRERAYAPYSKFAVGAAIRTARGTIYSGCNVENASYPEGWCAETSAIAAMVGAGESMIAEVVVCAADHRQVGGLPTVVGRVFDRRSVEQDGLAACPPARAPIVLFPHSLKLRGSGPSRPRAVHAPRAVDEGATRWDV